MSATHRGPPKVKRSPCRGPVTSLRGSEKTGTVYRETMPPASERRIEIAREPFGEGFDVRVKPPVENHDWDREFPTYREARGWAGGLKMSHGWKILDRTGGEG